MNGVNSKVALLLRKVKQLLAELSIYRRWVRPAVFSTALGVAAAFSAGQTQAQDLVGISSPLAVNDLGSGPRVQFVDIDGDGDFDAFIGEENSNVRFFRNTGSSTAPAFSEEMTNPLGHTPSSGNSNYAFADMDNDGDIDAIHAVVSAYQLDVTYLRNDGTATTPSFTAIAGTDMNNPFYGLPLPGLFGPYASHSRENAILVDMDDDGDYDMVLGYGYTYEETCFDPYGGPFPCDTNEGKIVYFENTGTAEAPDLNQPQNGNPFNMSTPDWAYITLGDLDRDDDLDLIVASASELQYYKNDGSKTAASFALQTGMDDPLISVAVSNAPPTLVDIDADGDQDLFLAKDNGAVNFFTNLDVSAPVIKDIFSANTTGLHGIDDEIDISVRFTEPVSLVGGNLSLELNTGSTVTIEPFTDLSIASTIYTVLEGQEADMLDVTTISLEAGATLRDADDNDVLVELPILNLGETGGIIIDGIRPMIDDIMPMGSASYKAGEAITFIAFANENGLTLEAELGVLDSDFATRQMSPDSFGEYVITTDALDAGGNMNEGIIEVPVTATDAAGNATTMLAAGVLLDKTPPQPEIISPAGAIVNTSPFTIEINFDEGISGFELTDIVVANATATDLQTFDNRHFTLEVTPDGEGMVTIDIAADLMEDIVGNTNLAADQLAVEYKINAAPTVANPLEDLLLEEGFGTTTVDLSNAFSDPDGDGLSFSATSADEAVLTVTANGNELTITEVAVGSSTITVTADDSNGGKVSNEFSVTIEMVTAIAVEELDQIKIYPNPASDFLRIDVPNGAEDISFAIHDRLGRVVQTKPLQNIQSASRRSLSIDVSLLDQGIYLMVLKIDGYQQAAKFYKR